MWRRFPVFLLIAAFTLTASVEPIVHQPGEEAKLVSYTNEARADHGKPALPTSTKLDDAALRHAKRMAEDETTYHNDNLDEEVGVGCGLGENVGMGPTVGAIHEAFMDSPGHRSNVLGSWTHLGVGVVKRADTLYVAVVFKKVCAPEPKPAPKKPQSKPVPAPPPPKCG